MNLVQLLRGPFHFLRPVREEIRELFPDAERSLPQPQLVFLEDEDATPLNGFPVLLNDSSRALRDALFSYLEAEETVQVQVLRRKSFDWKSYDSRWDRYRALLARAVENSTLSSFGRGYPGVFWLQHSLDIARRLKQTPKRVVRLDLEIGRRWGDQIKYRVFEKYLDRAMTATYDTVHRLANDADEGEDRLFPKLLRRMADNVLIFTEDRVSPDLAELSSYFNSYLNLDARDLRARLERLQAWHRTELERSSDLATLAREMFGVDPAVGHRELLVREGYVTFLAERADYDAELLLGPELVRVWEGLLRKLKEFELLHDLRELVIPTHKDDECLVFRASSLDRTWLGRREIRLSAATRPMDFLTPWVTDPRVQRFGLVYDISDFSQIVSVLHRAGSAVQDHSFRMMFRFQRRDRRPRSATPHPAREVPRQTGPSTPAGARAGCSNARSRSSAPIAGPSRPSSRSTAVCASPSISLTTGSSPIQSHMGGGQSRYEFFGQGVVELSRLTTGKGMREIEETKNMLLNFGYPRQAVMRFFEPLSEHGLDVVDKTEESRSFHAYINRNGTLVNEGIVATGGFVSELAAELGDTKVYRARLGGHGWALVALEQGSEKCWVGVRQLGVANLKGLDPLPVFEILDAGDLEAESIETASGMTLMQALDHEFARDRT